MEFNQFKNLIKGKKGTIFSLTLILVVFVMLFSLLGGLKYSAKSKLLVVQDTSSADAYAVSRSNEYLGNLLSQVVYSGSFFNLVINNPQYKINQDYFSGAYGERLKLWQKTVSTKTLADTGIIDVSVYHENPDQARLIALAVNNVLINNNQNYHGGSGVKVNILDQPLVSNYPDKPNLVFNSAFSIILGIFLSLIFIYLYPEKKYNVSLWPKSGEKKIKKVIQQAQVATIAKENLKQGPISIKVETENFGYKAENFKSEDKIKEDERSDEEIKEDLFKKDIFIPNGDISGVLR